jgi:hypothetical protein
MKEKMVSEQREERREVINDGGEWGLNEMRDDIIWKKTRLCSNDLGLRGTLQTVRSFLLCVGVLMDCIYIPVGLKHLPLKRRHLYTLPLRTWREKGKWKKKEKTRKGENRMKWVTTLHSGMVTMCAISFKRSVHLEVRPHC